MINQQKTSDSPDYRSCFPNFLWLLRDVSLEVPENKTPQQFIMDTVFDQSTAVGKAIMTLFPSIECQLLPVPTANSRWLKKIEKHESDLEREFTHGIIGLTEYLQENVKVKHGFSHGQRVDGPTLALLLEQYLEAVNTEGTIPCLENTWNAVVEMRCSHVIDSLVKEYEAEMEKALHDKLPIEEEATPEENSDPNRLQKQMFLMEIHSKILREKEEKLLKEVKYVTPAENAHEPDADTQYKKELIKKLQSKIIETKSAEIQDVTGGVIKRFMDENHKKSRAYCVRCFDELSAPVLENLQSITVATTTPDAPRYTFQQFVDERANLQINYDARAIGPAKHEVWEEKVAGLKDWEPVVMKLDGYQKEMDEKYQQLAESDKKQNELRDRMIQEQARTSRLESEMKHLEKRLMQEHQETLQQVKADAAEKIAKERAKAEDLKKRKETEGRELTAALQRVKELEECEQDYKQKLVAWEAGVFIVILSQYSACMV